MISRRRFLGAAKVAAPLAFGVGIYTWQFEPHWLEVVYRPLPIHKLPPSLVGKKLVQLSDLHLGPRVSDDYLFETFERVAALNPDVVVYTGDFTSYEDGIFAHADRVFPRLARGSLATLGILGNHDYGPKWAHPEVAARLADQAGAAGVRMLRNQTADVSGLQIVGMDDLWARQFHPAVAFAGANPVGPMIVLSHNPDTVDHPGWEKYQGWILAGHTHGGQCKAPFLPPPLLPVKNRRYVSGEYALSGGRRLYISRGVGHLMQTRFNVRPEVTVFELQPSEA